MESALRPRDIQARIRGGESAEDVAAAAQTTVESIMPFAAPVIAERAHVAQTAVKSSIRRASTESAPVGRTLDEASRTYFSGVSVRADDVEWDAWRREDGRWTVTATYEATGPASRTDFRAEFMYDQPGRYVVAENDDARLLTGESSASAPAEPAGRRLSAVPSSGDDLPLGDDALELVRERDADLERERAFEAASPPEAERAGFRENRLPETEQTGIDDLAADHADADWIAPEAEQDRHREHAGQTHAAAPVEDDLPLADHEPERPEPAEEPLPKKKGRSSVPSWDEIMFGGGKND